jgi:demethylspheroidene O-methyltransferase
VSVGAALPGPAPRSPLALLRRWRNRAAASPRVQAAVARTPLLRRLAGREEAALMDLVAGFVHSQVLLALVETGVLERLRDEPAGAGALHPDAARMEALLRAAGALGLVEREGQGWRTSLRGAALLGAPGAVAMIRHHRALYADLADPVALLDGRRDTELARVWSYVGGEASLEAAARYSALMAATQAPVAAETLAVARLGRARHLIDAGGGTGTFAIAAARRHPGLRVTILDLPAVEAPARAAIEAAGLSERVGFVPGDARRAIPPGADAVSLVRVLYDHSDETVLAILRAAHAALAAGGRLMVSEPMSGGNRPRRATDGYFALYCMAMGTGRLRSAAEVANLLKQAGFETVQRPRNGRPSVTSVVVGHRSV